MLTLTGKSTISIHVWNLAAYNAGDLVGGWVDLDNITDLDGLIAEVAYLTHGADEYIISDRESDYGIDISEHTPLMDVWTVHETLCELSESDREAFGDYLAYHGGMSYLDTAIAEWRERYCGQFDSIESYAWHFAEDIYPDLANVPSGFRVEVDTVAWECDHWISDNGHVFRSF